MAAITYMKFEQNYIKYIINESISQNLQPIINSESNKYYCIVFTASIIFIQTALHPKFQSPFCYYFFDTVYHSIPFTQYGLS